MAGRKGAEHASSSVCSTSIVFPSLLSPFSNLPVTLLTYADRLYLASYAHAPTSETPFPYPESNSRGSPTKRSQRAVDGPLASSSKAGRQAPYYFSIDDILLYNAFHHDFGPLHIGHLYRFALQFHDVLGAKSNETRPIVFWSYSDPKCLYSPSWGAICQRELTVQCSSCERRLHARMLHGADPIMATSFGTCTHRPGRTPPDAFP